MYETEYYSHGKSLELGISAYYYKRAKRLSKRCNNLAERENDYNSYIAMGGDEGVEKKWNSLEKSVVKLEKELEERGIRVVIGYDNPFCNYRFCPIDKWEERTGKTFNRETDRDKVLYDYFSTGLDKYAIPIV